MVKIEDINIEKWGSLLNDLHLKKNEPSTHVVCLVQNGKERSCEVLSKKDWEEYSKNPLLQHKYSKLRLKQIISISNQLFSQVSKSAISYNPFVIFLIPIAKMVFPGIRVKVWEKTYFCSLIFFRIPDIICKNCSLLPDDNGKKNSDEIIKELKKLEDERQQLIGIYSSLKVMTEKSDVKNDQRIKSIWERCYCWLSNFLFQTTSKKIDATLKDLDQNLPSEIGSTILKANTFRAMNENLLKTGQKALSVDDFIKFTNGLEVRNWAGQKFGFVEMYYIKKYSHMWDRLEEENVKIKQAIAAQKGFLANPANNLPINQGAIPVV